ncbi:MAG: PAS domain S-box protein [Calditrichaeota bacterium]|nr:MAG: PAS domain S-box protein [Calditrichota bacterium]
MSKYLDEQKENIKRVNKLVDDLSQADDLREKLKTTREKYNRLLERYEKLDKVFQFHKGIVQNLSSGIITTDMKGHITFLNKSALQLLAYTDKDILGKPMEYLFADSEQAARIYKRVFEQQDMYESKEINLKDARGALIPIGFSTTLFRHGSTQEGVVFIFRDIREQINFRRQMGRMDRLATLGELAAGLAHEIRNPLAGIKTSSEVLLESLSPGDFRTEFIKRIIQEIDRSNGLLQRFFNFAKPSRPKPGFHNLVNIVDSVFVLLRSRLLKRNIEFERTFEQDAVHIYIDEYQFEQVLLNLFLNAMDAMPDGGIIRMHACLEPAYTFEGREEKGAVVIRVEDNGHGIPPEKIENIFLPFYTTKSDGVGLGLSICTRLMDENSGKLEVQSKLGEGTVFSLYLPYVKNIQQES